MARALLFSSDVMARPSRREILGDGPATVHLVVRAHNRDFLLAEEIVKATLQAKSTPSPVEAGRELSLA